MKKSALYPVMTIIPENMRTVPLSGISIFQSGGRKKNPSPAGISGKVQSSGMTRIIQWFPGKRYGTGKSSSDLLLLLSVFLFVGRLTEEKEKELFAVTTSRRGVAVENGKPHSTFLFHCATYTFLLFGTGLLLGLSAAQV